MEPTHFMSREALGIILQDENAIKTVFKQIIREGWGHSEFFFFCKKGHSEFP